MRINILAVGRSKETYLSAGVREYLGRLKHYAVVNLIEIKPKSQGAKMSPNSQMDHEAKALSDRIRQDEYVIALERTGTGQSSAGWVRKVQNLMNQNRNKLVFVIGGEEGLSAKFLAGVNESWSLSPLTFTHDMARLLLLEQLYRVFTILAGEKYHR